MAIYMWRETTPITTAGIYRNQTDGLISLSSDGSTRITIADKNLGATTVYNDGDTLSESNCGKYYQRGNNYGFPFTGSVTTSSTRVNASNYGPGNYYSSSRYITYNGAWDTTDNGNLWGGVTGTNEAMQGPCLDGFHVPLSSEWVSLCGILTTTFGLAKNATTMGTYLKMPKAGYRSNSSAGVDGQGSYGYYWSSSRYDANNAYNLYFSSGTIIPQIDNYRASGFSVRPFKNEAVQPDDSWTVIYQ